MCECKTQILFKFFLNSKRKKSTGLKKKNEQKKERTKSLLLINKLIKIRMAFLIVVSNGFD